MYDIIILATTKNVPILNISLPYIRKKLDWDGNYVVANHKDFDVLQQLDVELIDENTIFPNLSYVSVANVIDEIIGERKRAGWYLQQFIKMAWSLKTEKPYYVVFDADTIPLNQIQYISNNDRYLLTQKKEFHKPYFDTISRLFSDDIKRSVNGSFIAENMIIDTLIMKTMIEDIESNTNIKGDSFFEKILNAINIEDLLGSGFSEFETYGNYIYSKFPEKVELRTLKTCRESMQIIGSSPSAEQLEWAAKDYEIISIEASDYNKTFLTRLTGFSFFRKIFRMKTIAKLRTGIRSKYRKLIGKEDYVFD